MRTRAQNSRDAGLRRLTRVNHSLAIAAVVGAGVVTDVVANTPSGHASTVTTTGETSGTGQVALLTSPQYSPTHKPRVLNHRVAPHHRSAAASSAAAVPPAASSSDDSSQSSATPNQSSSVQQAPAATPAPQPVVQPTPQPTVVAVSGGS